MRLRLNKTCHKCRESSVEMRNAVKSEEYSIDMSTDNTVQNYWCKSESDFHIECQRERHIRNDLVFGPII